MGNGLEVRGNESNSGHYSAANQTAYSGNFLGDPSTTNSHAVIYDRKYSEMNSTHSQFTSNTKNAVIAVNQGNLMQMPNKLDVPKDIVKRSSVTNTNTKHLIQAAMQLDDNRLVVNSSVVNSVTGGSDNQVPPSSIESQ